jgi:MoaA/NifB/PqqE/SkfB family radical SAM enzyme
MELTIAQHPNGIKTCSSKSYNYRFNQKSGDFIRWGKTLEDDPKTGFLEIFDLEVSEVCSGIPAVGSDVAVPCAHCYKSNTKAGRNMSFDTFKSIFDKLPQTLTQIAFGIGDLDSNPDLVKMFEYCRNNDHNPGVVPNLTINGWGLTEEWVATLSKYLGGIAVSRYDNFDVCYDAVKKMTDAGMSQVNVHMVVANENLSECYKLIDDAVSDPRLAKMKAIVFLTLKPKGKRNKWTTIKDVSVYKKLIQYAFDRNIGIGFDSCSAPTFLASMKDHPKFEMLSQLSESCESDRFSGYANVEGIWSHCSFTEGLPNWGTVDLKAITDFDKEVWNSEAVTKFRGCLTCQDNKHISSEVYLCPVYDLYSKEVGCANSAVVVSDRKELEIRTAPKVIIPIIKYHDPKTVADQLYGE